MSDIESPRSPASPERTEAQSKRRRLQDAPDRSSRYSSPDELADNDNRHASQPSRLSSGGLAQPRDTSADESRSRSESPDELDHTIYRRDETGDRSSTQTDSRSRSQTPPTPENEDNAEDEAAQAAEPSAPAKKPFNYKLKYSMLAHRKGIAQTKFSPDGEWLASVSADGTAKIWLASTGKIVHELYGHLAGISAVAWSPDSLTIATGSDDKTIRIWSLYTGEQIAKPWQGHHNYVFSLAFSPKGNILASGSFDEALFIWDVRGARQMRSLPAHSDPIGSVDFTPDGTLIASCATDGLIRIWDAGSGQCLRTIVHEDNAKVTTIKFSPNGKFILAWTVDNCIRLWDYVTGQCKKTYQGHKNTKYSISGGFGEHEGEAFVVSPSEDGKIVFWDVKTKEILQQIKAHKDVVMCVDTDPTSGLIVSCDKAGYINLWEPAPADDLGELITSGMENVNVHSDDDDESDNGSTDGSGGHTATGSSNAADEEDESEGDANDDDDDDGLVSITLISPPRGTTPIFPRRMPANAPAPQIPRQGLPSNEQLEFQRGLPMGTFDGAGAGEADVQVEDLMQGLVDEIMSDGVDAEASGQIQREMDGRL